MIEQNEILVFLVVLNVMILYMFKRNYIIHLLFLLGIPIYIMSCEIIGWFQILMLLFVIILNSMSCFFVWKEFQKGRLV
jgi:uncharacterized membrane-anchored protein YitT (DUF2179 family)